ncbi:hypothetical protein ACXWTF_13220, partial [Thiomicrolovo sp. ZZH C-3]
GVSKEQVVSMPLDTDGSVNTTALGAEVKGEAAQEAARIKQSVVKDTIIEQGTTTDNSDVPADEQTQQSNRVAADTTRTGGGVPAMEAPQSGAAPVQPAVTDAAAGSTPTEGVTARVDGRTPYGEPGTPRETVDLPTLDGGIFSAEIGGSSYQTPDFDEAQNTFSAEGRISQQLAASKGIKVAQEAASASFMQLDELLERIPEQNNLEDGPYDTATSA